MINTVIKKKLLHMYIHICNNNNISLASHKEKKNYHQKKKTKSNRSHPPSTIMMTTTDDDTDARISRKRNNRIVRIQIFSLALIRNIEFTQIQKEKCNGLLPGRWVGYF